jgi:hypothetical protein
MEIQGIILVNKVVNEHCSVYNRNTNERSIFLGLLGGGRRKVKEILRLR